MAEFIASDDANPAFIGQKDPDRALSVLFYSKAIQNAFRSTAEGRPIFDDTDMVKIMLPGDDKNIIDTFAREDHKARWPRQWAHYENKRPGDQRLVGKTPLEHWQRLTPAQSEELRAMKFFAVDDIANASDAAIQRIGMAAGMAPHAFREAAQRFLAMAAGEAAESKTADALKATQDENAKLRADMAAMQARMEAGFAQLAVANVPQPEEPAAAPDALANLAKANPSTKAKG